MMKNRILVGILMVAFSYHFSFSQKSPQEFVLSGVDPATIEINQTFTTETEIFPFDKSIPAVYGLSLSARISLENDQSLVRVVLVDRKFGEYLVYEAYSLLYPGLSFSVDNICEETCILNSVEPQSVRVEVIDAEITISSLTYASGLRSGTDVKTVSKEKKLAQNRVKIIEINKSLKAKGLNWVAGPTSVSEMTYAERKELYGQSKFPSGFEYYMGGVFKTDGYTATRETSLMVDEWDWRDRHGQNWITPVKNQGSCGSCWAFAATGATEAMVNLFFNQHLDMNLAEQDILSCSGAGTCSGGYPGTALNYIASTGIVDEATFPYTATDQPCSNKGTNPSQRIKIGGKIDFGSTQYPQTNDDLKRMIIEKGPASGGLYDWSHAMVLPGYKVVEEGDHFYYRDLNLNTRWITVGAGDPLIGETVWIFKNSWGSGWGDNGYVYVQTNITNIGWTHALLTPVQSLVQSYDVICGDNDGDGFYWWGLGAKPASCNCPDYPDGDDSDPNLGPLDEYGYCTILTPAPPVAGFTGSPLTLMEGQTVNFTDQSTNFPTSWSWSFEGGTPATSSERNPVVTYSNTGVFDVSLTVTNGNGSDSETIADYIEVTPFVLSWCSSYGSNVAKEWIQSFKLGSNPLNNSGNNGGYGDYTGITYTVDPGSSYSLTMTPGFSSKSWMQYWRVWVDYNQDGDFMDTGEEVFAFDGAKGTVSGNISIPAGFADGTRMRVSMRYNGAPGSCGDIGRGEVEDYTLLATVIVPQPPVADFAGNPTTLVEGNTVQFTDLSQSDPTSWSWDFPGGTPSSTTEQNPSVVYNTAGTYSVTMTATNDLGSNTKTVTNYITVTTAGDYCASGSLSNDFEWISQVEISGVLSNPSGASLYSDFTGQIANLSPGTTYNITLTPGFTGSAPREFWRIWIDYSGDGDFEDTGELAFTANNKKSTVTGTITIPTGLTGQTRMRVAMKQGSSPSPCETFPNGEVEDYTADFDGGPSGFANANDLELNVYPNPASNQLNIYLSNSSGTVNIKVYNMLGRIIEDFNVVSSSTRIDLSLYPKGLYYIGADDGQQHILKKFVKN
jgi:PKD repeat protein